MSPKLRAAIVHSLMVLGAAGLAAASVYLLVWGDKAFKKKALDNEAVAVRDSEALILDAEERLASGRGIEPVKERLIEMEEGFLSNDQMRRRLLVLGDIYMINYKRDPDDPDRVLYYDLAAKSYERALEYCKGLGKEAERNEIIRRMAEMYMESKDYAKAIALVSSSKELQSLPIDRWHFKMIEAQCLLQSGKPYSAANAFGAVADECEDKALWGEAIVRQGQTYVDAAANPEMLKSFLTKDGSYPEGSAASQAAVDEEVKKLLASAMADFEKALTKANSFDKAAGDAKLGMLRIAVLRKDKKAAYEIVNSIQASPMLMRDKAESMVALARLHESLGEYKTAIKLLEACSQSYPLSSMFIQISMDLYDYYKKADEWEKAFTVAERVVMRGPDNATLKRIVDDLSPDRSEMLDLIRRNPARDHYIDRLQAMLDKIKETRPESWKTIQHQANLILTTLLFISGKYPQAEKAILGSLEAPLIPKKISDELYYLDLECALKAQSSSPAIVAVRAKRYLQSFPTGKYYQDALSALLDAYFEMGLYDSALEVARRMYMDDLMRRSANGKPSKYWIRTVAKIGECYAKLGKYDRANQILRDNSKEILASSDPAGAFKIWSKMAELRGQEYEAMRRLDVVIPRLRDSSDRADLIVARYLLQLKVGNDKDFQEARELLAKIVSSSKIEKDQKRDLERQLYKGLLEYAFNAKSDAFQELLDAAVKSFGDESWPQYWLLLSLSQLYGKEALGTMIEKYERILSDENAFKSKDSSEAAQFVRRQLDLIKSLNEIVEKAKTLKNERRL